MDILFKLCIIEIDSIAERSSAEVGRTAEDGIAEISIICKLRTSKIGKSKEIASAEFCWLKKSCIIEYGINLEIGFFEGGVFKEITVAELD